MLCKGNNKIQGNDCFKYFNGCKNPLKKLEKLRIWEILKKQTWKNLECETIFTCCLLGKYFHQVAQGYKE